MTINDHNKKSDFVLMKSLVLFYGQVKKALRSISHMLVSLIALIFSRYWIIYRYFLDYLNVFSHVVKS